VQAVGIRRGLRFAFSTKQAANKTHDYPPIINAGPSVSGRGTYKAWRMRMSTDPWYNGCTKAAPVASRGSIHIGNELESPEVSTCDMSPSRHALS
jgi:hypothetical protein